MKSAMRSACGTSRAARPRHLHPDLGQHDPAQHNFNQHITDGDDLGTYDYGSIMHYPRNAFTINGQDTIIPRQALPAGVTMGQRSGLSAGDIAGVHTMSGPRCHDQRSGPLTDPVTR
jgi:hypothetical protein